MISQLLYNLSVRGLSGLYHLVSPFHPKAALWVSGRKVAEKVLEDIMVFRTKNPGIKLAWFHCASLGEFEQGRPVIEAFREAFPEMKIVLTFFSPSGYEIRKNYTGADFILYLPADTPARAEHFVETVGPSLAVFVKYEFWSNYLKALHESGTLTIGISVILRPGQLFFRSYGGFFRNILHRFDHLFVQNEVSASLLKSVGYEHCTVAGDTRFDRVATIAAGVREIQQAKSLAEGRSTLVAGSVWKEDMEVLIPFINRHQDMAFIIAPHEIHEEEISGWQKSLSGKSARFSESNPDLQKGQVLFIDNIGMLSSLYQYGHYAYIGGAYGKGLHNTLEAAVFGIPVFFGNRNYRKFAEAVALAAAGAAFPVAGEQEMEAQFKQSAYKSNRYTEACRSASDYVAAHTGATSQIMTYVRQHLSG